MNTCRKPLLLEFTEFFAEVEEWLEVMARKATNLPEELTEGRMLSVPTNAPFESEEMSCVEDLHDSPAPAQVSRK
jgi:hypothetical protein